MVIFGQISGAIALLVIFTSFMQVIAKKHGESTFAEIFCIGLSTIILAAAFTNIGSVILALIR